MKSMWPRACLILALLSAWMALPVFAGDVSGWHEGETITRLACNGLVWDEDRFALTGHCQETTELFGDSAQLTGTCDDVGDCGRRISQKCKESGSKGMSAKLVLQASGKYTCEGTCENGDIWVIACNKPLRRPKPQPTGE
jgi:hypothetical protein